MLRIVVTAVAVALSFSCRTEHAGSGGDAAADGYASRRARMVSRQLEARGIRDERVLAAMRKVPRHEFVLPGYRAEAYEDTPLPIEANQTISQPYIVALMTELAKVTPGSKVLEVGTGSGYQAAVLGELCRQVYTIEIVPELARGAKDRLARLGYQNVFVREGDGYRGWPEVAPFDAILVTAAPEEVPQPLLDQLAPGGRLVIPVGQRHGEQELLRITRTDKGFSREPTIPVLFVPMTGEAQKK